MVNASAKAYAAEKKITPRDPLREGELSGMSVTRHPSDAGRERHRGDLQPRDPRAEGRVARGSRGGIVALLGANGAGKTTTLKAISNLLRAERGEVTKGAIHFRGERVDRMSPSDLVKRGVVQVMEGRHCFAHLTVEENLLTGAYTRSAAPGGSRADLEQVYEFFPRLEAAPRVAWPATRPAASSR